MGCTEECKKAFEKYQQVVAEYFRKWPNHCSECRGWGGFFSTYDPSPAGVSLGSGFYEDFDPCVMCVEDGTCPRCAGILEDIENFELPCPHCGFEFDGSTDGQPPDFECHCDQVQESITDLYEEK